MREEKYEEKLLSFQKKLAGFLGKIDNPSDVNLVVWGLTKKTWSHCEMALELIITHANAEAIILLRAAYESTIRAYFLIENTNKIDYYKAFSELSALRNQLEVIDFLQTEGDEAPDEAAISDQLVLVEVQKKRIIDGKYHEIYGFKEEDLDQLKALKRLTNNKNMPDFGTTRSLIKKTKLAKALLSTGFPIYNLGSQMAHSSYGMTMTMTYREDNYPLYNEHSMYGYILLLLDCCCDLFHKCGAMSDSGYEEMAKEHETFKAVMNLEM